MNRNFIITITAAIVIVLAAGGAWYFAQPAPSYTGPPEEITVGTMLYEYSGLVFIADKQGFFSGNGLNVTFRDYVSSVASVKGVESGETDITLVPEYSIVTEAFEGKKIRILGNIDKYESVFLICRRDRGIVNVSDLDGRTISATRGTIGEFYLGRFLALNGIPLKNVTLVSLQTTQYVDAISNGSVDGVVMVYRYVDESRKQVGDRLVTFPIQSSQKGYVVLACRDDWAAGHPEAITRFLKSLDQAERYVIEHPGEAKAIIGNRMGYSGETMAAIWSDHQYSLTLDKSLVLAMEDEARWMIANNMTNATEIPDFTAFITREGMDKVKPGSVNIIG